MLMLIKRNLKLYFRDKSNIALTLIGVFVVLALYLLFLGDMMEQGLYNLYMITDTAEGANVRVIVAALFMSGATAITTVSTSVGAMGRMVEDKQIILKDMTVSPVSQNKITLSYIISSAIISMIMTILFFIIAYIYLSIRGMGFIGFSGIGMILLTMILTVLCANAMVYFVVMFIKSMAALSALSAIVGSAIGFIMGAFIFIGMMPRFVQWIIQLFPLSHSVSMFRYILADNALAYFLQYDIEMLSQMRYEYGVIFNFGSFSSNFWMSAGVLVVATIIFYGLSLLMQKKKSK